MDTSTNRFVWTNLTALLGKPLQSIARRSAFTFNETTPLARLKKFDKDQPRDQEGQWTKIGLGLDPTKKETWYRNGGQWNRSVDGEKPYGWERTDEDTYVPPPVTHKSLRGANIGLWGYSHYGSSVITGEAAKQMGLEGWKDLKGDKASITLATRMLQAIADDATGSEESLYHSFENVRKTVFRPGDTMSLPLTATAGSAHSNYGTRLEHENQDGAPTVFVFPKGTKMVGYSKTEKKDLEDIGAATVEDAYKEAGYIWDEAIVAGKFRVVKVETKYMGSQHSEHPMNTGDPIPQVYGQVVYLEPLETFDPKTGKWVAHG